MRLVEDPAHRVVVASASPTSPRGHAAPTGTSGPPPARAWTSAWSRCCARHARAVPPMRRGWLLVEIAGNDRAEVPSGPTPCRPAGLGLESSGSRTRRAGPVVAHPRGRRRPGRPLAGPPRAGRLGGRGRAPGAAGRLPARLRRAAAASTGLDGVPYGHFGDGCVHVRIDFELEDRDGRGTTYRPVHRAGRRPGGLLRRLDVGGARRRPGPLRAAPADVLRRRRSR